MESVRDLFLALLVFWSIKFCNGVNSLCDTEAIESLSMCSQGLVRGSFLLINVKSYTQTMSCNCTFRIEQDGFITIAISRVPEMEDCTSQVVLNYQTRKLIQCSKTPTHFISAKNGSTGTISFSSLLNSHGNTKYSFQFCGAKIYFICYDGEEIKETKASSTTDKQSSLISTTQTSKEAHGGDATKPWVIAAAALVPVVLIAIIISTIVCRIRTRRSKSEKSTILSTHLPTIDKLIEESTKSQEGSRKSNNSNQESIYNTIEDEDGYLKYPSIIRSGSMRYSRNPLPLENKQETSEEEWDNVNNGYLEVFH